MLKIGDLTLSCPLISAPLSGYTNWAMRNICRDFGAELTFPGVFLAKSAAMPKVLSKQCFRPYPGEELLGAQIMGTDPEIMAKAAKDLERTGYKLLDLNFACPAPKVLRRGRGGHMLSKPEAVGEIFERVRGSISLPISVKLRTGFDSSPESLESFYQICEKLSRLGADALVIHGRTTLQKYSGSANWEPIYEIKRLHPELTVIGSGDIFSPESAAEKLNAGLDGVLLARGIVGNPWLISEARAIVEGREKPAPPTVQEAGEVMIRHIRLLQQIQEEGRVTRFFRKFASQYCKRHPERKKVVLEIMEAEIETQLLEIIKRNFNC
ncbi:putative tRNA-dihydrouridine synthase [Sedimentisphaera cyanobacteriorum]|uniref:tRNA-dihydrouridine synthase n=1 Tax=Sedimentisphaera cyanobacteriorum TaxID=1940790 RepID=A0A1Q2HQY1_9BACT|nr:tRNA-dihydrouridine synthase [Sedimentisphaera cyanobacteriorum]AQQ09822.1 putative tRNA-dihydrouridine synthase [Sedimentisphaera cyanobacteriorum]